MFDTTPLAHALHEPCYIVEAHPPGTEFPATGLPQFLLNYENDDDAERELGTDSRLTFQAPSDGEYLVRIRDTRDFGGKDFKYQLAVRPESPSFELKNISGQNPTLIRGVHKRFGVTIDRKDNFSGPVEIEVNDLPAGIAVGGPITVEPSGLRAFFTVYASENAPVPAGDAMSTTVTATALIGGQKIRRTKSLGNIKLGNDPKLKVSLSNSSEAMAHFSRSRLPVLEIRPGETITAQVSAERLGHKGRITFGKEDAALNLPFGVYVDNTGLNGVLIPPGETERTIFLTAEHWVEPCERLIFLEAAEAGKPATNPALLRVLKR
jgi:translation initiation factor IF-1